MAFTYGFYNSKGGDRKYNADQMGNLFDGILNDGVFDNVGNIFATVPGEGLQVLVKSGRAWFNKTWSYNDAAYPIYLERPDVAVPRIDAIVLEVDRRETHRRNRIGYIVGIPDSTPKKPTLTNTDLIHQHPLAYVTVRAGTESILHSDIEIRVGQSDCPFVTGILQTANIDDLFAAWNEQFTTWFEGVKSQLEGDVAANLLREIQLRLPIADKSTKAVSEALTDDTKWMTPLQTSYAIGKHPSIGRVVINGISYNPITISTIPNLDIGSYMNFSQINSNNGPLGIFIPKSKKFIVSVTTNQIRVEKYTQPYDFVDAVNVDDPNYIDGVFVTDTNILVIYHDYPNNQYALYYSFYKVNLVNDTIETIVNKSQLIAPAHDNNYYIRGPIQAGYIDYNALFVPVIILDGRHSSDKKVLRVDMTTGLATVTAINGRGENVIYGTSSSDGVVWYTTFDKYLVKITNDSVTYRYIGDLSTTDDHIVNSPVVLDNDFIVVFMRNSASKYVAYGINFNGEKLMSYGSVDSAITGIGNHYILEKNSSVVAYSIVSGYKRIHISKTSRSYSETSLLSIAAVQHEFDVETKSTSSSSYEGYMYSSSNFFARKPIYTWKEPDENIMRAITYNSFYAFENISVIAISKGAR